MHQIPSTSVWSPPIEVPHLPLPPHQHPFDQAAPLSDGWMAPDAMVALPIPALGRARPCLTCGQARCACPSMLPVDPNIAPKAVFAQSYTPAANLPPMAASETLNVDLEPQQGTCWLRAQKAKWRQHRKPSLESEEIGLVDRTKSLEVEARLLKWVATKVSKQEVPSARQVRDSFHKQHRAAGGLAHDLNEAIQNALVVCGVMMMQPQPQKRGPKPRAAPVKVSLTGDPDPSGTIDSAVAEKEQQLVVSKQQKRVSLSARVDEWVLSRAQRGEQLVFKKVRDSFHKQHTAAGGTREELCEIIREAFLKAGVSWNANPRSRKRPRSDQKSPLDAGSSASHPKHEVPEQKHMLVAPYVPIQAPLGSLSGTPSLQPPPIAGLFLQHGRAEEEQQNMLKRQQIDFRMERWIEARVARGETPTTRQVRDSFHKQHRAAGGSPQELTTMIHNAFARTGVTMQPHEYDDPVMMEVLKEVRIPCPNVHSLMQDDHDTDGGVIVPKPIETDSLVHQPIMF